MEDNFDDYGIEIESDVLSCDFDTIDLYGDIPYEEEFDGFGEDIEYE